MKIPPRGKDIIECKSIEFAGKDIIVIESWSDFIYLLGTIPVIFKLDKSYYNIQDTVIYVYTEEK